MIPVAHALRGEGFDASEDGTGRGTPLVPVAIQERAVSENPDAGPDGVGVRQDGAAYTLEARTVPQAVAFDLRGREGGAMPEGPHDTANLRAASGGSSRSYVAQVSVSKGNETLYPVGVSRDGKEDASTQEADTGTLLRGVRETLGAEAFAEWLFGILDTLQPPEVLRPALHGGQLRPAKFSRSWVVYCALSREEDRSEGAVQSLREACGERCSSSGWEPSEQRSKQLGTYLSVLSQPGPQAERFLLDMWDASEGLGLLREALSAVQKAWRSAGGEGQSAHAHWQVRRLTPEECEFLQAMPRGYTRIPYRGKPAYQCPDGPRYKALGNSMAVNVMDWIGERIAHVDRIIAERTAA